MIRGRRVRDEAAERERLWDMLRHERALWKKGLRLVAGVDEVGVGTLAGPVMAAAVVFAPRTMVTWVRDSKELSAKQRAALADQIRHNALAFAFGQASHEEVDAVNVLQASKRAMERAVLNLKVTVEHCLVDARTLPDLAVAQTSIIHGDQESHSIAAASIVAKVERDQLMCELDQSYPGYGFARNKGYATDFHLRALAALGPCPIHRKTFAPVKALLRHEPAQRELWP